MRREMAVAIDHEGDHQRLSGAVRALGPYLPIAYVLAQRQPLADFVDECDGRRDRGVGVDLQDPVARGLIDGGELVEAAAAQLEVLDVDLDGLPGDGEFSAAPRAGPVRLDGREFSYELIEAVSLVDAARLRQALAKLRRGAALPARATTAGALRLQACIDSGRGLPVAAQEHAAAVS
jgi:hypothetical protein